MLKRFAIVVMNTLLALFVCANAPAATISSHKTHTKTHHIIETPAAQKKMAPYPPQQKDGGEPQSFHSCRLFHSCLRFEEASLFRALLRQLLCRQSSGRRHHC